MDKPLLNLDQLEFEAFGKGDRFGAERADVSRRIGARKLGYGVVRLAPGKRAWPYHAHFSVEEMFYVISGEGTLRHAGEEFPIRAGDFICSPADPDQPHQIINSSDHELVYLALGTAESTDIFIYPDSGKYGAWHGDMNGSRADTRFIVFGRKEDGVDYWDGEAD